jgi:hypothetical protein
VGRKHILSPINYVATSFLPSFPLQKTLLFCTFDALSFIGFLSGGQYSFASLSSLSFDEAERKEKNEKLGRERLNANAPPRPLAMFVQLVASKKFDDDGIKILTRQSVQKAIGRRVGFGVNETV